MIRAGFGIVVGILFLNTLTALAVLLYGLRQKAGFRAAFLMISWFIFLCPLAGPVYIAIGQTVFRLKSKKRIDLQDISFSQDREKLVLPPDRQTELNFVPIQDAMTVSDTASLRRLLMDVMRTNPKQTISSIALAINSKDTEASHYAASIVLDILSDFRAVSQKMMEQMDQYPDDVEINLRLIESLHETLDMKIMTEIEQSSYIYSLDTAAENLFTRNLWYMTATHYLWMVDLFISIRDFAKAEIWAERARQNRPEKLDTYKSILHLYFAQKKYDEFLKCLQDLKRTDIAADEEVLNLFRIYA